MVEYLLTLRSLRRIVSFGLSAKPTLKGRMLVLFACLLTAVIGGFISAEGQTAEPVSYYKQIQPILQRTCQGCHQPAQPNGELVLTSFEAFQKGGMKGEIFTPGNPDDSLVIEYISGDEPLMPKEGKPLTAEEVELFRRWIASGAINDTPPPEADAISPSQPPVYKVPPVISALAYSPDGKTLAVSGYREVLLHKSDGSELINRLVGKSPRIESIVYTSDGTMLAAVGGAPAQFGEVQLWDTIANTLMKSIRTTYDTLYGGSFSPDGQLLAFGCADKTARVISVADGEEKIKFDNHSDWVFGTTFSKEGKHLVTGSRDQALKLVEVESGSFIDDINASNKGYGGIRSIARHPKVDQVLCAGDDQVPRLYQIFRQKARDLPNTDFNLIRAFERQAGPVNAVAFSPDGTRIVAAGASGEAHVYNVEDGKLVATLNGDPVATFTVAFHPDGQQIAMGGFDGQVRIFNAVTGELIKAFVPVPLSPEVANSK